MAAFASCITWSRGPSFCKCAERKRVRRVANAHNQQVTPLMRQPVSSAHSESRFNCLEL